MKRMLRFARAKCPVVGIVSVLLVLNLPQEVRAHASLVRSQPAPGAVVQSPTQIDLWFNELLEDGFNSVAIIRAEELTSNAAQQQTNLARKQPFVDPRDRAHLTLQVGSLLAGNYVAEWRVLSRDGHTATGRFRFQVVGSH
jgi:methionine-rich copper-binding protein CopC